MSLSRCLACVLLICLLIGGELAILHAVNDSVTPSPGELESPGLGALFLHHLVSFASISGWFGSALVLALLAAGSPYEPDQSLDVRDDARRIRTGWKWLDDVIQAILTLILVKPLPEQKPLIRKKGWRFHLWSAIAMLVLGVLASTIGLAVLWFGNPAISALLFPWLTYLIFLGWLLTVGAVRRCHASLIHAIVHNQFSGDADFDRRIATWMGTVFLLLPVEVYHQLHIEEHHDLQILGTRKDPDGWEMVVVGFSSEMSAPQARRHMIVLVISPSFHYKWIAARFSVNFGSRASKSRRRGALAFHVGLAFLIAATCYQTDSTFPALAWLLAWVVPITVGVNISALIQFCSEHFWRLHTDKRDRVCGKDALRCIARLTPARFCAEPLPPQNLRGITWLHAWAWWWVRLFVVHVPVRLAVLPVDVCVHNWHHLNPGSARWVDANYAYVEDIIAGRWTEPRHEFWGIGAAMDAVFSSLVVLEEEDLHKPLPLTDVLLAM
jgi:hypothetical protein